MALAAGVREPDGASGRVEDGLDILRDPQGVEDALAGKIDAVKGAIRGGRAVESAVGIEPLRVRGSAAYVGVGRELNGNCGCPGCGLKVA